jgi:hypothetical protein
LDESEEWGVEWAASLAELISTYDNEWAVLVSGANGNGNASQRKKVKLTHNYYLILD